MANKITKRSKHVVFVLVYVLALSGLLLCRIESVQAASSLVQVNFARASSSPAAVSYASTPTAGDLLVAICSSNTAATITAPTGFSTAINESSIPAQAIFYKVAQGNESSISCAFSAGGSVTIQIYEYSGIENVSPLDAFNSTTSSGTTSPASSGLVTTKNTNDLLIAGITSATNTAISSWSNSFTQEAGSTQGGSPSGRIAYASADHAVSSTGSYSTTAAVGSANWRGQIAAFKIAPSAAFSVDMVDNNGNTVTTPSVNLSVLGSGFTCQTSTGTLGISTQKIRVTNTTPTNSNGWTLTLGASQPNWSDGAGHSYSYNNSSGTPAGCTSGQLTVNPTISTLQPETSPEYGCTTTGLATASQTAFVGSGQITLASAGSTSSHYCYWDITGIGLSQKVPPVQHSGNYSIGLTLTLTAL